jgi:hypothetical protein
MLAKDAQTLALAVNEEKTKEARSEEDQLTERYHRTALQFIKDAAKRGSYSTGVCYSYPDRYDRKSIEIHEWALQRAGTRLKYLGYEYHFYNNRNISTMGISITWK